MKAVYTVLSKYAMSLKSATMNCVRGAWDAEMGFFYLPQMRWLEQASVSPNGFEHRNRNIDLEQLQICMLFHLRSR